MNEVKCGSEPVAVSEAAASTAHVAANIADVDRGAAETGASSSQVLSAAHSLSDHGSRLKLQVDEFLRTVRAA
jgi:methyl-accepting chemotaxis protein